MNAMREFITEKNENTNRLNTASLSLMKETKNEEKRISKEFLDEKLDYFYNHGGPDMGI